MITVEKLIEFLQTYSKDAEVKWNTGEEITNLATQEDGTLILSNHRAIGYCTKCDSNVYKTSTEGYEAYCPTCDEDKYTFEFGAKSLEGEEE